jgi:hypothetical protein
MSGAGRTSETLVNFYQTTVQKTAIFVLTSVKTKNLLNVSKIVNVYSCWIRRYKGPGVSLVKVLYARALLLRTAAAWYAAVGNESKHAQAAISNCVALSRNQTSDRSADTVSKSGPTPNAAATV